MSHVISHLTRRSFLQSSARLSPALTILLGATQAQDVHAGRKKKKQKVESVAARTQSQKEICEVTADPPGKLAVMDGPDGGNSTECKGGESNGWTCFNPKSRPSTCFQQLTTSPTKPGGGGHLPPGSGNENPANPSSPVTDPAVPPTGGNEQPGGGGAQPGGGGAVGPTGGVEQPANPGSSGGGVVLTSYSGGKRRRRRKGNRRRRN